MGMRFPSGTEWGPPGNPRGCPQARNTAPPPAAANTSSPEKQARSLGLFLKKCSSTFQVPSGTQPAGRCQDLPASSQQRVLLQERSVPLRRRVLTF